MIISIVNPKGGVGKSTLAHCLAYSEAVRRRFRRVALIEADPQGTLAAWAAEREARGLPAIKHVEFLQLLSERPAHLAERLRSVKADLIVLDVPGESIPRFWTRAALELADRAVIPLRPSAKDEQALEDVLLPVLEAVRADRRGRPSVFVVPSFVSPQAVPSNVRDYFGAWLPEYVTVTAPWSLRAGVQEYDRAGETLNEYAKHVRGMGRAVREVEAIAKALTK